MAPAVKRELPPRSASGAASTINTDAPVSRAASAAHSAALPPPTTITSYPSAMIRRSITLSEWSRSSPVRRCRREDARGDRVVQRLVIEVTDHVVKFGAGLHPFEHRAWAAVAR